MINLQFHQALAQLAQEHYDRLVDLEDKLRNDDANLDKED